MHLIDIHEQSRLASLCRLNMLDTRPEQRFDRLTTLAAAAFGVPIALVSLVDAERQWFKSRHGLAATETPRSMAFCSHAIKANTTFVVNNAPLDPLFADNPLVTGAPHIRFYAGHPLLAEDGNALGTLCIIDTVPRAFGAAERAMLQSLADLAQTELHQDALIDARVKAERALRELNAALDDKNEALSREIRQRSAVEASLRASVAERLAEQHAHARTRALLDAVLDTVDVAVFACDADGKPTMANRAARHWLGQAPARADGADGTAQAAQAAQADIYHADGGASLAAHATPLRRALAGETVTHAKIIVAPHGQRRRGVLANARAIVGADGARQGALVAMTDLGELTDAHDKLRATELRLRAITDNLPTLIVQVDGRGCVSFLNTRALRFYGQPAEAMLGRPLRAAYSDADYALVAPHIAQALAGVKVSFDATTTIDGKRRHYHASFLPNLDEHGAPDGFCAMAFDITARRENEIIQGENDERLRTITNNVPVLIAQLDTDLRFRFANAMYKDWLGVRSEDMVGRTITEVFGEAYYREREASLKLALGGNMSNLETRVSRKGQVRVLSTTYIPQLRDGVTVGIYVLSTDATASREHERHLLLLVNADPLTGLPNRRMYEEQLGAALAKARRQKAGLALMYLDLDNFKHVNDTLGHAAGDAVLIEFGRRVKSVLRDTDMLARLAGDEFTVVLDAVDSAADCAVVANKMLTVLAAPFVVLGHRLAVSASIGVVLADATSTATSLTHHADAALYAAKRAGKNRFSIIEEAARAPATVID